MKIEIVKCKSGFYAVMVDGRLWSGACKTREHAEQIADRLRPAPEREKV